MPGRDGASNEEGTNALQCGAHASLNPWPVLSWKTLPWLTSVTRTLWIMKEGVRLPWCQHACVGTSSLEIWPEGNDYLWCLELLPGYSLHSSAWLDHLCPCSSEHCWLFLGVVEETTQSQAKQYDTTRGPREKVVTWKWTVGYCPQKQCWRLHPQVERVCHYWYRTYRSWKWHMQNCTSGLAWYVRSDWYTDWGCPLCSSRWSKCPGKRTGLNGSILGTNKEYLS